MILANDFLEYLLNTERDLAARVRDRYDMYLKSLPVPQLADGKIVHIAMPTQKTPCWKFSGWLQSAATP